MMMMMVILMTMLFVKESLTQNDCSRRGDVRLVGTPLTSQGVVEVCLNSHWSRVCRDGWGNNDAAVVCNQLGYGREGALALMEVPVLDSSFGSRNIIIDDVSCGNNDRASQLLDCSHKKKGDYGFFCQNGGDAGVRCREEELRVKNVSAATVATPYHTKRTVTIFWELHNNSSHRPSSFTITCFNPQHYTRLSMINGTTMQISIGDLLSASYGCCISATYYGNYVTEGRCTSINTEALPSHLFTTSASIGSEKVTSNDINMQTTIIGGVLGSIIIILLLLLALCGGALLFLLCSRNRIPKMQIPDGNNSVKIPRYMESSTSRVQALQETDASTVAADYSRIGPCYETIDSSSSRRQQPVAAAGRRNVAGLQLVRLSERYEFSEPSAISGDSGDGHHGDSQDYEIPQNSSQSEEHEAYSRLQH